MKKKLSVLILSLILAAALSEAKNRDFDIRITGTGYVASMRDDRSDKGRSLQDLLAFLPEISYSNGSYSINGISAAGVYIDGSKVPDQETLKHMPAVGVSAIEVTYAAPGDSSAESSGGEIYVTTSGSAGKLEGAVYTGGTLLGNGRFDNASLSAPLRYRAEKYRISSYTDYAEYRLNSRSMEHRYGENERITESSVSGTRRSIKEKVDFEYAVDSLNKVFAVFSLVGTLSDPKTNSAYSDGTSSITGNRVEHIDYKFGAGYSTVFPKKKVTSILSLTYTGKDEAKDNSYFLDRKDGSPAVSGDRNSIHTDVIQSVLAFYIPAGQNISISTGAEFDAIISSYGLKDSYGNNGFDDNVKSASTKGYISRVYGLVSGSRGKLKFRAGLNLQSNIISYNDHTYALGAKNIQYSANPTLKLLYPISRDGSHTISLIYRHSLGSIPYNAITPYRYWSDQYNYTTGNTSLKAPSSDVVMTVLSLLQAQVNIGLSYRYDRNQIYFGKFRDSGKENVIYTSPINLEGSHTVTLSVDAGFSPARWMRTGIHGIFGLLKEDTSLNGIRYDGVHGRCSISLDNSFFFGRGFGAELNGMWSSGHRMYEKKYSPVYTVAGSVYKTFLSGRLRLAVDFTALASGERYRMTSGDPATVPDSYELVLTDLSEKSTIGLSAGWTF